MRTLCSQKKSCHEVTLCDILRGLTPSFFMHGSLDPEEKVMAESEAQLENHLAAKRKAIAVCNQGVVTKLYDVIAELGWDCYDNVAVEIGGTSVYGIDGAGTKWAPVKGTRKYNKDAFIVIKNKTRDPIVPSQPNPDLKQHHE